MFAFLLTLPISSFSQTRSNCLLPHHRRETQKIQREKTQEQKGPQTQKGKEGKQSNNGKGTTFCIHFNMFVVFVEEAQEAQTQRKGEEEE